MISSQVVYEDTELQNAGQNLTSLIEILCVLQQL